MSYQEFVEKRERERERNRELNSAFLVGACMGLLWGLAITSLGILMGWLTVP